MTLKELAKIVGVSSSTISRALTHPDMVAAPTREKILAAVEKHGYRTNHAARSLRTQRSEAIGLVVSDVLNPFYSAVVKAVEGVATRNGYSLIICNANENADDESRALRLLSEKNVAGIILASTGANASVLKEISDRGTALVAIDREAALSNVDTVLTDNAMGSVLVANHLLSLGHSRIATIAGPQHITTGRERLQGFQDALARAGVSLPEEYVQFGDFRKESGYVSAMHLLTLPKPPTAIYVANNEMVAGTLGAIRDRGIALPTGLSLVSFDDVRWAEYIDPPLTVVSQPVNELGALAAELLFNRMKGPSVPVVHRLPPSLIVRGTTAPLRVMQEQGR